MLSIRFVPAIPRKPLAHAWREIVSRKRCGALGSRNTTEDRNRRLREVGVTDDEIARVFAPCGLDIGASTVEETAVAVLAEIIAQRSGRQGRPLREAEGPIRHMETATAM